MMATGPKRGDYLLHRSKLDIYCKFAVLFVMCQHLQFYLLRVVNLQFYLLCVKICSFNWLRVVGVWFYLLCVKILFFICYV